MKINTLIVSSRYESDGEPAELITTDCLVLNRELSKDGIYDFVNPRTFEIEHKSINRYLGISEVQYGWGKETIIDVVFREGVSKEIINDRINTVEFRIRCELDKIKEIEEMIEKHNHALNELRILLNRKKLNGED